MGTWIEARPKLVIPGVLNSLSGDECHITMAYLGDADPTTVHEMMTDVGTKPLYANSSWPSYGPIVCEISGTAAWRDGNNKLFRVALVQPAVGLLGLHDLYNERDRIINNLKARSGQADYPEVRVDETYPFIPHITLPERWQDQITEDGKVNIHRNLPELSARVMFVIDAFYVSSSKDGNFTNIKL